MDISTTVPDIEVTLLWFCFLLLNHLINLEKDIYQNSWIFKPSLQVWPDLTLFKAFLHLLGLTSDFQYASLCDWEAIHKNSITLDEKSHVNLIIVLIIFYLWLSCSLFQRSHALFYQHMLENVSYITNDNTMDH